MTWYVKANATYSVLIALSYSFIALFGVAAVILRYWRGSESIYTNVSGRTFWLKVFELRFLI